MFKKIKEKFKNSDKGVLSLIIIYLILTPFLLTPWIHSNDGVGYYSYLRSFMIDHDINLENEYQHYKEIFPDINIEYSPTGKLINRFMIGCAIYWSPFFIIGHLLTKIANLFGANLLPDGYSMIYIISIAFGSSLYALFGLLLLMKLLREFFSKFTSFITIIGVWFATPLIFYMWFMPSVSHAISFFSVTCFIAYWFYARKSRTSTKWLILGLLGGLMTLVRHQNGLFMVIPLLESIKYYYLERKKIPNIMALFKKNLIFLIGLFIALLPQIIVFKILTGSPFSAIGSAEAARQLTIFPIHLFKVLLATHGLFSWTPILLLAVTGLWFFYKVDKELMIYFTTAFLLQLYLLSSWEGWYGGAAFGQRKFLSSIFVFAFGLASLISYLRKKKIKKWMIATGISASIVWNLGLLVQFGSRMIPPGCCVSIKELVYNNFFEVPKKMWSILKTFLINRAKFLKP